MGSAPAPQLGQLLRSRYYHWWRRSHQRRQRLEGRSPGLRQLPTGHQGQPLPQRRSPQAQANGFPTAVYFPSHTGGETPATRRRQPSKRRAGPQRPQKSIPSKSAVMVQRLLSRRQPKDSRQQQIPGTPPPPAGPGFLGQRLITLALQLLGLAGTLLISYSSWLLAPHLRETLYGFLGHPPTTLDKLED